MKLNSITPAITKDVSLDTLSKKAQEITDTVVQKCVDVRTTPKVSIARINLELNAESMSPNEYIAARNYISDLEMDALIASEMKFFE